MSICTSLCDAPAHNMGQESYKEPLPPNGICNIERNTPHELTMNIWAHFICLVSPSSFAVIIDSIYKVTEGRQSEIFHRHAEGNFDPSCCFTIYHGNHMESLDLITSNPEEARTWITGLKYLMAGISDEDSLAKRQRTHDQYPFKKLCTILVGMAPWCILSYNVCRGPPPFCLNSRGPPQ